MANKTGERVRELRNKLGLSQDQLGQMLGYTGKAAISKIETGVNGIAFGKVNDFACVLHTSSAYLLCETDISEDVWHSTSLPDYSADELEITQFAKALSQLPKELRDKVIRYGETIIEDYFQEDYDAENIRSEEDAGLR